MNFNQGWVVFLLLGASALSWVFGKLKEKAEAEEAKKRAQLRQQNVQRQSGGGPPPGADDSGQIPIERMATLRKQQLAQLRKERLEALRAEMAGRLQGAQARTPSAPTRQAQPAQRQPARRPAAAPLPSSGPQQQSTHTNVATMRKPPSVSHDHAKLAKLGTHAEHAEHKGRDQQVHRLVTDAESTHVTHTDQRAFGLKNLTNQDWRRAIILSELLAPPVSLRSESPITS